MGGCTSWALKSDRPTDLSPDLYLELPCSGFWGQLSPSSDPWFGYLWNGGDHWVWSAGLGVVAGGAGPPRVLWFLGQHGEALGHGS